MWYEPKIDPRRIVISKYKRLSYSQYRGCTNTFYDNHFPLVDRLIINGLLNEDKQTDGRTLVPETVAEMTNESEVELYHNHLPRLADAGFIKMQGRYPRLDLGEEADNPLHKHLPVTGEYFSCP